VGQVADGGRAQRVAEEDDERAARAECGHQPEVDMAERIQQHARRRQPDAEREAHPPERHERIEDEAVGLVHAFDVG
jgi:hypothetical protein